MKLKPYVEKLEQSEDYRNFKIKYPDAFMVAGFFVLDLEAGMNVHQIDFYLPKEKKIAAFTLDEGVQIQILDMISKDGELPKKLDLETNIDLDALEGILADEMHNRGISEEIKKIIAVVQNIEGKKIWNLNCVLTGMEILKSHVEDESKTVLKMDKTSVMDVMKHLPSQALVKNPPKREDLEGEMENLEKMEAEIEKEKTELKKELGKNEGLPKSLSSLKSKSRTKAKLKKQFEEEKKEAQEEE
ncbi:hypothetical protein J4462_04260 [Candidatus Pacearchaeota archaeon]|nr:hypothetical protein [Candidatus Pacearchaeota archaeon]